MSVAAMSWLRRSGGYFGVPLLLALGAATTVDAAAQVSAANASAIAPLRSEEGVRWQALSPAQREALAPLEREWPGIDASRKQKWLALSARFKTMAPAERARITERMQEWARLTPAERGQARLRFEEARQVPAPDRNARWQAYQALPPDARANLAARAASSASGTAEGSRREATGARASKSQRESRDAKANLVPSPAVTGTPKQVAPTLVQAAPGATTTLITRRPTPPVHQQIGMPKIAATPEFVNRSTLLPKRGPQAAVASPPPSAPPAAAASSPP